MQQSQPSAKEPLPKLTNRFQLQEVKGYVLSSSFSLAGNPCNTVAKGAARVVFPAATALGPGMRIMQNNVRISKGTFHPQTQIDSVNLGSPSRPVENITLDLTLTILHLTLKMTTAQVVETSATNNSLSKDCPRPDDHAKQISLLLLYYVGKISLNVPFSVFF